MPTPLEHEQGPDRPGAKQGLDDATRGALLRDFSLNQQFKKIEQSDPSVLDLAGEASYSAIYSGVQSPAIGLAQLADRGLNTSLAETINLLPAPAEADFGSTRWYAQQFGGGVGMILPFAATRGTMKGLGLSVAARTEMTLASGSKLLTAAKGASIADAALTGFAYDFAMTPVASEDNNKFWEARTKHGLAGAATFTILAGGNIGLRHATRSFASELNGVSKVAYESTMGALPGIPAGVIGADVNSKLTKGEWATNEERIKGAYTMFVVGGGISALHLLPGQERKLGLEKSTGKANLEALLEQRTKQAETLSDTQYSTTGVVRNPSIAKVEGSASRHMIAGRAMASGDVVGPRGSEGRIETAGKGSMQEKPPAVKIKPASAIPEEFEPEVSASAKGPKKFIERNVEPAKSSLDPTTAAHLAEFAEIMLKPQRQVQNSLEQINAMNDARLQGDGFIRHHRSPLLEDAIKDWSKSQSRDVQQFVEWAYEGPRSDARRSNYLMDLAMAEAKATGYDPVELMDLAHAKSNFYDGTKSRGVEEPQQKSVVDTLLRLMEDGNDPRNPDAKTVPGSLERKAALQMLLQAGEPTRIVQSNHPTCALGSLEVDMFYRHPDVAAKAVSDVLRTGKFTTTDGTVITVDPKSLKPEFGSTKYGDDYYRSYASEVFQTLASNVHWQTQTVAPDGRVVPKGSLSYILRVQPNGETVGYVVDKSGPNPRRFKSGGYHQHEVEEIGRLMGGEKTVPAYVPDLDTPEALARFLSQHRSQEGFPMIAVIDARHLEPSIPDVAPHAVTVLGAFNIGGMMSRPVDVVNWHNTWQGRTYPHTVSVKQFWNMTRVAPKLP